MSAGVALLTVEDLTVTFGYVHAVNQLSFEVRSGELIGLIGPNGAGKTTVIDALTGFVRSTGTVHLDGKRIDHLTAHRRARRGLTRTFQSLQLFEDLSVAENLQVGGERRRPGALSLLVPARGRSDEDVDTALEAVGLAGAGRRMPDDLSHGQRKLVSVARGLAARPRLLLLDEPAAGLDNTESLELGRRLRAVVAAGTTVLMVDHDMGLVLSVCDRVVVLDRGGLLAVGDPESVRRSPQVVAAYLGTAAAAEEAHTGESVEAMEAAAAAQVVETAEDTAVEHSHAFGEVTSPEPLNAVAAPREADGTGQVPETAQ